MAECDPSKNMSRCNCTAHACSLKGQCCECLHFHLSQKQLPACAFPDEVEKTYDRSFARFAACVAGE